MYVRTEHIDDFISYLRKEADAGCEWLAYNIYDILRLPANVEALNLKDEGSQHRYKNLSDLDYIHMVPLVPFLQLLQEERESLNQQSNAVSAFHIDTRGIYELYKKQQKSLNNSIMNEENYKYLAEKQMPGLGFREPELATQLKEQMANDAKDFKLLLGRKYGDADMQYTLNFSKSEKGYYFFNNYQATLTVPGKKPETNLFYTDQYITAKEAFNLMEGRAVYKTLDKMQKVTKDGKETLQSTGETYNGWLKINFNDTYSNGNYKMKTMGEKSDFNLVAKVQELPIPALKDSDNLKNLVDSLRRGNIQSVTYEQNDRKEQRYIEASPWTNGLNIYSSGMNLIEDRRLLRNITPEVSETKQQHQEQANKLESEPGEEEPKKGARKGRGRRV